MSVRETTLARAVYLATGDEWNGLADGSAALDVAGRNRLASSGAHRAADGGVSGESFPSANFFVIFSFSVRIFLAHEKSSGILRAR